MLYNNVCMETYRHTHTRSRTRRAITETWNAGGQLSFESARSFTKKNQTTLNRQILYFDIYQSDMIIHLLQQQ